MSTRTASWVDICTGTVSFCWFSANGCTRTTLRVSCMKYLTCNFTKELLLSLTISFQTPFFWEYYTCNALVFILFHQFHNVIHKVRFVFLQDFGKAELSQCDCMLTGVPKTSWAAENFYWKFGWEHVLPTILLQPWEGSAVCIRNGSCCSGHWNLIIKEYSVQVLVFWAHCLAWI